MPQADIRNTMASDRAEPEDPDYVILDLRHAISIAELVIRNFVENTDQVRVDHPDGGGYEMHLTVPGHTLGELYHAMKDVVYQFNNFDKSCRHYAENLHNVVQIEQPVSAPLGSAEAAETEGYRNSLLDVEDRINAARRLAEEIALMGNGLVTTGPHKGSTITGAADRLDGKLIKIGKAIAKLRAATGG